MEDEKAIVLCADDYGISEGVSRGILQLLDVGRISATSAMTNLPAWPRTAGDLRPFAERSGLGLHLNLTAGAPLGTMRLLAPDGRLPPLRALVAASLRGKLPISEVEGEIVRQIDAFEQVLGRSPDFVDGHQHVHALPGVRDALARVLRTRALAPNFWVRDPADRVAAILARRHAASKAFGVKVLSTGFRRLLQREGFRTNEGFSGFASFDPAVTPEQAFGTALRSLGPRPVVMAHPGYGDAELQALDPVVATRAEELAYLASENFGRVLRERRLRLVASP